MNNYHRAFGAICLAISPSMCYPIDSVEYPKDLLTSLDRVLGKHNEDYYNYVERTYSYSMNSLSQ